MISIEDVFQAYYICRKNKRSTESAIEFEVNYEENCIDIWREINDRIYEPSKSIAFIVYKPRIREIFAANFRDRIIHHLIDMKIRPLLEEDFIEKTCNNRIGKGTSKCVEYLYNDIKYVSNNYSRDCYVCKMDMKGFFMSIRKDILTERILDYIDANYFYEDKEDIKWLIDVTVNDNPEQHCKLRSPLKAWKKLDKNKSLFFLGDTQGLPIGNLISQLLANFYLNEFDHYVTEILGFVHYGRYVDDFYIVSENKEDILNAIPFMRSKLNEIGIELHKNKFYIQHYKNGIEFVGSVIKPNRIYVHNRTVYNAFKAVEEINKMECTYENIPKFLAKINSYLGLMKSKQSYSIRRNLLKSLNDAWWSIIYVRPNFCKVILRKKFNERDIIRENIKKISNKNIKRRNGKSKYYKRKAKSSS